MKTKTSIAMIFSLFLVSCDPKMGGPVGYIFSDEINWKLVTYTSKGKELPVELATQRLYMRTGDPDDRKFLTFQFLNKDLTLGEICKFNCESTESDRWLKWGSYIMRTEDRKFFFAIVRKVPSTGQIINLEISNLMNKEYSAKNDTTRYIYIPVDSL